MLQLLLKNTARIKELSEDKNITDEKSRKPRLFYISDINLSKLCFKDII